MSMSNTQPKFDVLPGGQADLATADAPHAPESEQHVLRGVIYGGVSDWAIARDCGVKPKAFYDPARRIIWSVLESLYGRGEVEVDDAVLWAEIQAQGKDEELGGVQGMVAGIGEELGSVNFRYHADRLKYLWDLRYTIQLSRMLGDWSQQGKLERDEWIKQVGGVGARLITLGRKNEQKLVADHMGDVANAVAQRASGELDKSRWVESSLPRFNSRCKPYNSGIQDDGLVLVGGGSGNGKSVWLRQEALAALMQGKMVLFISRETGTGGVTAMMAASLTAVDLNNLETTPKDHLERYQAKLAEMREKWADKTLFCIQQEPTTPLSTVEDLEEQVRVHVHRRGTPDLICVDYLQLFDTRKKTQSREQTVSVVSHALQALQRELKCVVMVAAQLNESGLAEMRTVKRDEEGKVIHRMPKPGDLRESQAMYHDADRVVFLYKPPVDCRDCEQFLPGVSRPEMWVYQEKRRSGGVMHVRTWFEKRYTRFIELSQSELDTAQDLSASKVPTGGTVDKHEWKKKGGRA